MPAHIIEVGGLPKSQVTLDARKFTAELLHGDRVVHGPFPLEVLAHRFVRDSAGEVLEVTFAPHIVTFPETVTFDRCRYTHDGTPIVDKRARGPVVIPAGVASPITFGEPSLRIHH